MSTSRNRDHEGDPLEPQAPYRTTCRACGDELARMFPPFNRRRDWRHTTGGKANPAYRGPSRRRPTWPA